MELFIVYACSEEWGDYMVERRKRKIGVFRTMKQAHGFCDSYYKKCKGKNAKGYDIDLVIEQGKEVSHWEIVNTFNYKP